MVLFRDVVVGKPVCLASVSQLVELFSSFSCVVLSIAIDGSDTVGFNSVVEEHGVDDDEFKISLDVLVVEHGVVVAVVIIIDDDGVVVVVGHPHGVLESTIAGLSVLEVQPEAPDSLAPWAILSVADEAALLDCFPPEPKADRVEADGSNSSVEVPNSDSSIKDDPDGGVMEQV